MFQKDEKMKDLLQVKKSLTTIEDNDKRLDYYVRYAPEVEKRLNSWDESLLYKGNDTNVVNKLFWAFHRAYCPNLVIDDSNRKVIHYLLGMKSQVSPKPGIIIRGNVGTGKTLIVRVYISFLQRLLRPTTQAVFLDPATLKKNFVSHGYEFFDHHFGEILFLDDLGMSTRINHYGTEVNLASELILSRYKRFKKRPSLQLICTTNLLHDQLIGEVGERAMSRLDEMCAWDQGALTGEDRRPDNPMKVWPNCSWGKVYPSGKPPIRL